METVDDKILKAMGAARSPKTFTLAELSNCGRPDAVRQAISRLVRVGGVRRIRPGLYDLPKTHPIIGTTAPNLEATVKAIMQRSNAKWQFSGAYAANLLGLSEQVPAKVVIITDGVARNIDLGKMTLSFRRVAPRNLLGVGATAGLVFQALRYIGSKSPDLERHAGRLRRTLDENTKSDLVKLTPKMPVWMQGVVRSITREKKNGGEGKYDTLAIEENYLADGLAKQALAAAEAMAEIEKMPQRAFAGDDPIDLGALVELDFSDLREWFILAPPGGGTEVRHEGTPVTVITPESPLGLKLIGSRVGDQTTAPAAKIIRVE